MKRKASKRQQSNVSEREFQEEEEKDINADDIDRSEYSN